MLIFKVINWILSIGQNQPLCVGYTKCLRICPSIFVANIRMQMNLDIGIGIWIWTWVWICASAWFMNMNMNLNMNCSLVSTPLTILYSFANLIQITEPKRAQPNREVRILFSTKGVEKLYKSEQATSKSLNKTQNLL